MNDRIEATLRVNADWARFPCFDRKGWAGYQADALPAALCCGKKAGLL